MRRIIISSAIALFSLAATATESIKEINHNIIRVKAPVSASAIPQIPVAKAPEDTTDKFSIEDSALPQGENLIDYYFDLNKRVTWTSGAKKPLSWSLVGGLPKGFTLTSDGLITGFTGNTFNGSIVVTATSSEGRVSATLPLTIINDMGTKPLYANINLLYRFDGGLEKEGSYSHSLVTYGNAIEFERNSRSTGQVGVFNGASGLYQSTSFGNGMNDYSAGGWIYPRNAANYQVIIQNRDVDNNGQYMLRIMGKKVSFWDYRDGVGYGNDIFSDFDVKINEWNHVVFSRTGNSYSVYLNGRLAGHRTVARINNNLNTNGFSIGYDQRDNDGFFNGYMQDIFEMSRALKASEVKWLYKSGQRFPSK